MRTKIVAALVAGGLLVGAGLVTAAISAANTAEARANTAEARETDGVEQTRPVPMVLGLLEDVLDDLVADETITSDQADAIVEAAEEKATELKDRFLSRHGHLAGLLEDGVITEEESSELPDDHWLFGDAFDEAWQDGELSAEDLRERFPNPGHLFRRGLRFGALLDDGGIDREEYDSLDDDHPLKQIDVSEYLEDGLITPDEFREILPDLRNALAG